MNRAKKWYNYLWIWSVVYFALGFFNIVFAWLGMIDFVVPLLFAIIAGNKGFCNRYCGRGQLFSLLGERLKGKKSRVMPRFFSGKFFRYGFLAFFMTMFASVCAQTYFVASGKSELRQVVKLLWTFKVPWKWAYSGFLGENLSWVAQFSYGFYSLMLTSTIVGLLFMILWRPRSWCAFCPMGTMTQSICKLKSDARKDKN